MSSFIEPRSQLDGFGDRRYISGSYLGLPATPLVYIFIMALEDSSVGDVLLRAYAHAIPPVKVGSRSNREIYSLRYLGSPTAAEQDLKERSGCGNGSSTSRRWVEL
jgi:hypothetical protein